MVSHCTAPVNCKTSLTDAIIDDDLQRVKMLLCSRADVNEFSYFDGHGEPPLLTAIRYMRPDILRELLNFGADVKLASSEGDVPVVYASERVLFPLMFELIQHGADVNAVDKDGCSALYWAVKAKNFEAITGLIECGANVDMCSSKVGKQSMLHLAVKCADLTEYLLSKGAKINAVDDSQETPLFSAIRVDNLSVVELLLSRGAHVNHVNHDYRTPLHLAAASINNSHTITELLLKCGAKVNARDRYFNTPLVLTLRNYILQPNREVVCCLIKHGSNLHYRQCAEALEWMISSDLDVLRVAVSAGFRLIKARWVHQLLSKGWINREWHILRHDDKHRQLLIDYVRTELRNVPSLSFLCRIVIREQCINVGDGLSVFRSIRCLLLPAMLKDYLMMVDE